LTRVFFEFAYKKDELGCSAGPHLQRKRTGPIGKEKEKRGVGGWLERRVELGRCFFQ